LSEINELDEKELPLNEESENSVTVANNMIEFAINTTNDI